MSSADGQRLDDRRAAVAERIERRRRVQRRRRRIEDAHVGAPIGQPIVERSDARQHELARQKLIECDAGHEKRIVRSVVDDGCVRGDFAVAVGDFHFDATVAQIGNAIRGEHLIELQLLECVDGNRDVFQLLAAVVEDAHDDIGRLATRFDEAEVRAIRRRLRDLLKT